MPILELRGIMLYQEQVIRVLKYLQATLRKSRFGTNRAISRKRYNEMSKMSGVHGEIIISWDMAPTGTERLFSMMAKFTGYGFVSHALAD